jgi:hypothetical protein
MAPNGKEFWHRQHGEVQHVVAGRFRADSPIQLAVIDRTPVPTHRRDKNAWAILYLYDLEGNVIWQRRQEVGAWAIGTVAINWFGAGRPSGMLVYGQSVFGQRAPEPAVIYDGQGKIVATLPLLYSPSPDEKQFCTDFYALAADVWGDGRQEVILFGPRGACIYANARPLEEPTLYNETLYPGM